MATKTGYRMTARDLESNEILESTKFFHLDYKGVCAYAQAWAFVRPRDCIIRISRLAGPFSDVQGYVLRKDDEVKYYPRGPMKSMPAELVAVLGEVDVDE